MGTLWSVHMLIHCITCTSHEFFLNKLTWTLAWDAHQWLFNLSFLIPGSRLQHSLQQMPCRLVTATRLTYIWTSIACSAGYQCNALHHAIPCGIRCWEWLLYLRTCCISCESFASTPHTGLDCMFVWFNCTGAIIYYGEWHDPDCTLHCRLQGQVCCVSLHVHGQHVVSPSGTMRTAEDHSMQDTTQMFRHDLATAQHQSVMRTHAHTGQGYKTKNWWHAPKSGLHVEASAEHYQSQFWVQLFSCKTWFWPLCSTPLSVTIHPLSIGGVFDIE